MSENPSKFRVILIMLLLLCGGVLLVSKTIDRSAPTYNATVSGTVTIEGILAESGIVTFHPVAGGQPAMGNIHSDGSYSLRSGQGNLSDPDGGTIASGGYVVTVASNAPFEKDEVIGVGGPPMPGPSLVANKYRSSATSDLKQVVKPGPNVLVLNLEAAAVEEVTADQEAEPAKVELAAGEVETPNSTDTEGNDL